MCLSPTAGEFAQPVLSLLRCPRPHTQQECQSEARRQSISETYFYSACDREPFASKCAAWWVVDDSIVRKYLQESIWGHLLNVTWPRKACKLVIK